MRIVAAVRRRGVWLSADDALVIMRFLVRAHIYESEPGADVVRRFVERCEEFLP